MVNILGKKIQGEYVEMALYTFYLIMAFAIPLRILYVKGGIFESDFFSKTQAYILFFLIGYIVMMGKKILQVYALKNPDFYYKYGWLSGGVIHDPENGVLPQLKIFSWSKNIIKFTIFCILFSYGLVLYFGVFKNEFFAGTPQFAFEVSKFDKVLFGGFPGAPSETIFAFAMLFLFIVDPLRWILFRLKAPKESLWILFIIIAYIFARFLWLPFHNARYPQFGAEEARGAVIAFGFFSAIFVLFFNSIIPAHTLHDFNNFFSKSTELYTSDEVKSVALLTYLIIVIFGIGIWVLIKYLKKRTADEQKDFGILK